MARTSFCALRKPLSQMNGYLPASPGGNRRKLRGNLARRENRIDVNAHRVFHVSRVAARERRRHGNAALARLLKHFAVAHHESLLGQTQSAELIFAIRVGSADIKNNVRSKFL